MLCCMCSCVLLVCIVCVCCVFTCVVCEHVQYQCLFMCSVHVVSIGVNKHAGVFTRVGIFLCVFMCIMHAHVCFVGMCFVCSCGLCTVCLCCVSVDANVHAGWWLCVVCLWVYVRV